MSWPGWFFFPHVVEVRDYTGVGDDPYDARRTVTAEVIDERTIVRGRDNREVVSNTRVTVPVEEDVAVGALVTVWPGGTAEREAEVLRVGRDENAPPLPSHLILWLT